jgi:hypothetical protein
MNDIETLKTSEIESCTDYNYFKFRKIDVNLIKSLVNSKLYFSKPEMLNDPFDCRLDIKQFFKRAVELSSGNQKQYLQSALTSGFLDSWSQEFQDWGIASFSSQVLAQQSNLMWSHYGDKHRGVCLQYRFPKSFLPDQHYKVSYEENCLIDWLTHTPVHTLDMRDFIKNIAKIYVTTKSSAWAYENEARIINSKSGLHSIKPEYLEQIYFGLNTLQENIDLIIELATKNCGCSKFSQMTRNPNSYFGLIDKPLQAP